MSATTLKIIPEARREAAASALRAAFGGRTVQRLDTLAGGASGALVYRLEVDGAAYVLRLEAPPLPGLRDVPRAYACMAAAASAGVAPALHHADPSAGIAIMDFVSGRPLADYPGGPAGLAQGLGRLVARLHGIEPAFAPPRLSYAAMVEMMLGGLRRSGLFAPGLLDPHAEGLARVCAALKPDTRDVSSHNDPNPRNILFDGERLWLVDWELAFRNDPMVDLAILANEFAVEAPLVEVLVGAALGHAPDRMQAARLALYRPLTSAFYACALLGPFAGRGREPAVDLTAPTVEAFRAAVADGSLAIGSPELIWTYGKMHLAAFLKGLADSGCQAALREMGTS